MNFRKRTVAVATTLFRRARDAGLHNWHARQRAAGAGPRETPMPAAPPRERATAAWTAAQQATSTTPLPPW